MTESAKVARCRVVRVTQSPMNAQRWLLDLECGHEVWVTRRGRPTAKYANCEKCTEREKEQVQL